MWLLCKYLGTYLMWLSYWLPHVVELLVTSCGYIMWLPHVVILCCLTWLSYVLTLYVSLFFSSFSCFLFVVLLSC